MDVPITVNNGLLPKIDDTKPVGDENHILVPFYPADLRRHAGVIVGDDVRTLFEYARDNKFAIPAINVCIILPFHCIAGDNGDVQ